MAAKPSPASSETDTKSLLELPLPKVLSTLHSSAAGLSAEEAAQRLERYGPNAIAEHRVNPLLRFLGFFWGPIPGMIEVAALLSALVRHWTELGIILALLVINAVVGFWEEHQAGNTVDALRKTLALEALVKRGGKWRRIAARELVPGDVVRLRLGGVVPADLRLLDGDPIQVDQSALTGESLPVERGAGEAVYSGSLVKQGEIDGCVVATGGDTFFGRTAHMVESAGGTSHFQKAILRIGDYLIVLALALVILILLVALFRGESMMSTLQFALVLTVAAIPVALPTVLSVTLAVGARLLAHKQAVVTRLAAIEELAGVDVLCSDKTGTLTKNQLTLGEPFAVEGVDARDLVLAAALASREEDADPIDEAVIGALDDRAATAAYRVTHFQPFDPVSKRSAATLQGPDGPLEVSKGAPQVILDLVKPSQALRQQVEDAIDDFARRGYRALGVARRDGHDDWRLLGVLSLYDPPRDDSKATLAAARAQGLAVKMVTGDQLAIGREIGRQIGLGDRFVDATVFDDARHHEGSGVDASIEDTDGFAQVYPEHKFHIVDVLQRRGHIVGMTGDGVNDAPALKKADVGIAVSGATDAARSAAAIVLLAPGLSVIVDALRESRRIFERMNSYATYRITETIRVLLFMTLSILFFQFYPVTPVMIVLLALLNDGAILAIAYDRAPDAQRPQRWHMPRVLGLATVLGALGVVESFGLFYYCARVLQMDPDLIRTLIYLKLSVSGHLTIFVTRTRGPFWSFRPSRALLAAVVGTQLVATLLTVYGLFMTPIGWERALWVWAYALFWFVMEDFTKLAANRIFPSEGGGLLAASHFHRHVQGGQS